MQPQEHAINWDELLIEERQDEEGEGRLEIIDEDQLYVLLGLRTEDETAGGLPSMRIKLLQSMVVQFLILTLEVPQFLLTMKYQRRGLSCMTLTTHA